jgi:hypothetical protein
MYLWVGFALHSLETFQMGGRIDNCMDLPPDFRSKSLKALSFHGKIPLACSLKAAPTLRLTP